MRVFNIRLAKNGGLLPALRIARLALSAGVNVQLGCLVGETSILSAAAVGFLETCPAVRFVEGAFGKLLLREDVVRRPIRFGRRGRSRRTSAWGSRSIRTPWSVWPWSADGLSRCSVPTGDGARRSHEKPRCWP